jgi:hypothetical protein
LIAPGLKRFPPPTAKGLGQYPICDKLIAAETPAWGPVFKGRPPRWNPFYINSILSNRAVIGEYTPHTKRIVNGVRKRLADGAAIENYYPAVVPLALWQKVQEARRAFARAKFGESFNLKEAHGVEVSYRTVRNFFIRTRSPKRRIPAGFEESLGAPVPHPGPVPSSALPVARTKPVPVPGDPEFILPEAETPPELSINEKKLKQLRESRQREQNP